MNITQTNFVNASTAGMSSEPIECRVAAEQAARESFIESVSAHRALMSQASHIVDESLKAQMLEMQRAYLRKLEAENARADYILTAQQVLECVENDKCSNAQLRAFIHLSPMKNFAVVGQRVWKDSEKAHAVFATRSEAQHWANYNASDYLAAPRIEVTDAAVDSEFKIDGGEN